MTYEQYIQKLLRIEARAYVRWIQARIYNWLLKQDWLRKFYYRHYKT